MIRVTDLEVGQVFESNGQAVTVADTPVVLDAAADRLSVLVTVDDGQVLRFAASAKVQLVEG